MSTTLSNEQLVRIANEFGTPVYVYHAERIKEQFETLRNAFSEKKPRFFYACKALTNINILKYIKSLGCYVDCSSINEVLLALKAGFPTSDILYTSNSISFQEIEEAAAIGVRINIDSLSNLEKFGRKFGHSYPVGIRLRPNIMAGGNIKISTGHDSSKFGIPLEQIDRVLQIMKETGLQIKGLQIHTGSEIQDVDVFIQGMEVLFRISEQFPELDFLDLGGGFKIAYKENEKGTDIALLGKRIEQSLKEYEKKKNREIELWFEPGKYFLSRVNVIKDTPAITFAGIDTGLNHLIRPMFYGSYHKIDNLSNPHGERRPYNIVGNICETDTFAADRELPVIVEGDILVFYNAGAYGFEMASNYNSRFRPAEVLVKDGKAHLIRKREVLEDLVKNQIEIL
jgi:diaminopimelate decarboxylase